MIRIHHIQSENLTLIVCSGKVQMAEIIKTIENLYQGIPTENILWDFTDTRVTAITAGEIRRLAESVKKIAHSRIKAKTAIVASRDFMFGMARMYQVYAEISQQKTLVEVFRKMEDARRWIKGNG